MSNLTYLQGYPEQLLSQVRTLINEQRLGDVLAKRYPGTHDYATDKALWQYTQDLKNQFLRNAPPINKVMYDNKIHVLKNALGLHTAVSRVQGGKLVVLRFHMTAQLVKRFVMLFLLQVRQLVHHDHAQKRFRRVAKHGSDADLCFCFQLAALHTRNGSM